MPTDRFDSPRTTISFDDKLELLRYLLAEEGIQLTATSKISSRAGDRVKLLSFAQERLWFLDQLEPGKSVYNISYVHRLAGKLDVDALNRSVAEIIRRHEAFRSRFVSEDGGPVVEIEPSRHTPDEFQPSTHFARPISLIDLGSLAEEERAAEAMRLARQYGQQPFDLASGPLFRIMLIRLTNIDHFFVLIVHQMIYDWRSHELFTAELATFYRSLVEKQPVSLPDLPVQYAQFAAWQREQLTGDALEAELAFWKKRLKGISPVLNLPADYPRPAVESFRGARKTFRLSKSLTQALKRFAAGERASPFVFLLAAFKLLLYRYSGQESLVVGFPVANRNHRETKNLIGFFVNTLVLRSNPSGRLSFKHLLRQVQEETVKVLAHQDLPFEKLVESLNLPRDLSRNPLFQVMFILQEGPPSKLELPEIESSPVEMDPETAKFDLTLSLSEREDALAGFFEYSTDLFDGATIARMAVHFEKLLEGIVAEPDRPIAELPLLTEVERRLSLVEWNATTSGFPNNSCIHELFEAQAEKTPDAIALEFDGKQMRYRELNGKANQLARYLRFLAVTPDTPAGICVERSLEMVVGILGVLKAGGAYVPLDPNCPHERLEFMLEDSRSALVLTDQLVNDRLGSRGNNENGRRMIDLHRDWETIEKQSIENLAGAGESDDIAYVIYTSGSTGRPRGVEVSHRSVVNCLFSIREQIGIAAHDIWLAVTTIAFDIAALEIFLPLMVGGRVVIAGRQEVRNGDELVKKLIGCGATVMQATPAGWRMLIEARWEGMRGFKILCGGETLPREIAGQLLKRAETVWNLYGPTEATIWSTADRVESGNGPVPIGRPIANTRVYILDASLQPVPVGIHGDLYIGGAGLARGYLNQPELTAEKFIANPFVDDAGSRIYRTGDRARFRADGKIEFLGRLDRQVKIRGYRVELEEIEGALAEHPDVREAAVIAWADPQSGSKISELDKMLVAYIGARKPIPLLGDELRTFMLQKFPEYMVPSLYVPLNELPRTENGKINYRALPHPDGSRPELDRPFVAPRTVIEELIAQIWRDILRLEQVGVYDNFFELGGHSLVATRVISRIRDSFQIELPLRRMFETPTVAGIAGEVESALQSGARIEQAPIVPVPRDETLPPSIAQEPILLLNQIFPHAHLFNIPAAYRWNGPLDVAALEQSLNAVVERHEALRTIFPTVNAQRVQSIAPSLSVKLDVIDLQSLAESARETETRRLAKAAAEQPFDIARGPLFSVKLVRLADTEHLLFVTMHHIISDAWSIAVFLRDLARAYKAFSTGETPRLGELPIQFADFAHWQREAVGGEMMTSQLSYWEKQLEGPLPALVFSTGPSRLAGLNFLTARQNVEISGELYEALTKLSREQHSTLFMTVLSAFKILLYGYTGQEDIRIGTLVANRNRSETENLIGHFLNTVVLRTRLLADLTFEQLQRRVRETTLAAHVHQDLPFELLVRSLEQKTGLKRASLFQVLFVYQSAPLRAVDLPGVTVDFWDDDRPSTDPDLTFTTFDLILLLKERPGRLIGSFIYKIDRFDDRTIGQILEFFRKVIEKAAVEPTAKVDDFAKLRLAESI